MKKSKIIDKLIDMYTKDQRVRKDPKSTLKDIKKYSSYTTKEMKKIVKKIGWPTISKVGKTPSYLAWLYVQHTFDNDFAEYCLNLMKNEKDVDPKNIAFLEDRVRLNSGKKQLYGNIVATKIIKGNYITKAVNLYKPKDVNRRRLNKGLGPIEQQYQENEGVFKKFLQSRK